MRKLSSDSLALRYSSLVLILFTGATGLIYEVTWHRYLSNMLGSQARASAIILAVFLGGLSIGYGVFGRGSRGRRATALLLWVGLIEIGIGLWSISFPYIYDALWQNVGILRSGGKLSLILDFVIASVLIGPPTILMGGTLPLLTQGLVKDKSLASTVHSQVYAINTGGAFFGCVLAGFYLLPAFGLRTTLLFAAPINIVAGLLFMFSAFLVQNDELKEDTETSETNALPTQLPHKVRTSLIALIAGFCSLSLQVILMRVVALSAGASEYSFTMVVAAFILMLAVGAWKVREKSFAVPLWLNQTIACVSAALLYLSIGYWPYGAHVIRVFFSSVPQAFYPYYLALFIVLCLLLAIPIGAMGATMPLLFRSIEVAHKDLGRFVGRIYAFNTIGCVLGALLGGYLALYVLQAHDVFRICLYGLAFSAFLSLSIRGTAKALPATPILIFLSLLIVSTFSLPPWEAERMSSGLFRSRTPTAFSFDGADVLYKRKMTGTTILAHEDGPNTTVTVSEMPSTRTSRGQFDDAPKVTRNIKVNGKSDGRLFDRDMSTMLLATHLPTLLSSVEVKNAAVIGFGLGVTAGALTQYPEIEKVRIIEISPVIRELAHFFDYGNYNVTRNPKVEWSIDDAYRVLGGETQEYDLVVSEPSNPWVTGVERLFTTEFYEIIKKRLNPKGVYCQWIQLYSISEEAVLSVIRTFGNSFRYLRLFEVNGDLIILGSDAPFDAESVRGMFKRFESAPQAQYDLGSINIPSLYALLATEVWLPKQAVPEGKLHSLEHPSLAFQAGRDFFVGKDFEIRAWLSTPVGEPWRRRSANMALFGYALSNDEIEKDALFDFVRMACPGNQDTFFRGWERSSAPCRDMLLHLRIRGFINGDGGPSDLDVAIMLAMLEFDGIAERVSLEDIFPTFDSSRARKIFRVFRQYESALLPLSVKKLINAAARCEPDDGREFYLCQIEFIKALAESGYGELARELYSQLNLSEAEEKKFQLRAIVEAAEQAEAFVTRSTR